MSTPEPAPQAVKPLAELLVEHGVPVTREGMRKAGERLAAAEADMTGQDWAALRARFSSAA